MKRLKILLFIILIGILFVPNNVFATDEYTISTEEELKKFAEEVNSGNTFEGKTVKLMEDIDLKGNEDNQWTPIGSSERNSFKGTFEGNGHVINGIFIKDNQYANLGLFGYNKGNIYNVGVIGRFEGKGHIGGLAAYNEGNIKACFSDVIINVNGINAGGIVSWNKRWKCRILLFKRNDK